MKPAWRALCAGALLAAFAAAALWSARAHAPTYDEPLMLLAGYALDTQGEYRWENQAHPPLGLMLSGLPLMPLSLRVPRALPAEWNRRYQLADLFLNDNVASPDRLLFLGRLPSVLLGVGLGLVVYAWASRAGAAAGLLALGLYTTCGLVIDHAGLATNDMAVSFAMVAALFLLTRLVEAPTWGTTARLGAVLGAAVSVKHTGLFVVGLLPVMLLSWMARGGPSPARIGRVLGRVAVALGVAGVVLLLVYAGHPGRYAESLRGQSVLGSNDHPTFLLGRLTWTGAPWYYLIALGAKLPLPLLVLGVLGFLRRGGPSSDRSWLAGFAILLLWTVSFSRWLGLRYVLAVVPVLCVLAGRFVACPPWRAGLAIRMTAGLVLVLWQAVSTWATAPHFHAYFNELAGGPSGGYRILADSELDWGQDLKPFGEWYGDFLRRHGSCELMLSYFGTGDPGRYGLHDFQELAPIAPVRRTRRVNSARPAREILAVSATNLQGVYYERQDPDRYPRVRTQYKSPAPDPFAWLRREAPMAVIGHSIFVYDISGRRDVHERLADVYRSLGWRPEYERERAAARHGIIRP